MPDGVQVTVDDPRVRNDSIVGVVGTATTAWLAEDLVMLEVRQFSLGKTLGLAFAAAAFIAGVAVVSFYASLEN